MFGKTAVGGNRNYAPGRAASTTLDLKTRPKGVTAHSPVRASRREWALPTFLKANA
jgi:hypothetical protein